VRFPRFAAFVAMLVAVAVKAPVLWAECKTDTMPQKNKTLFTGIAALHFDYAGSSMTVNSAPVSMFGGDLSIAVCRWPAYTFGLGGEIIAEPVTTSYVAPGSTDFHPALSVGFSSVSVTRRWRNTEIVHPMLVVRAGSVDTEYSYYRFSAGQDEWRVDGKSSAPFIAPAAGVEVSLFKYMSVYMVAGARVVGRLETPGVTNNLSGFFASFGMGFGKFR
jgi:hypothetical protein